MFNWIKKAKILFSSGETTESGLVRIHDDGFMSDDIAVSIEDIVSEDDHEDIGKIFVLSLTEFHEALGETWDKREAKIFLLAESVLRQRIGAGNRWEHQSKEIYILLFPTLSEMEGAARTYDIAEELGLKIIGERFDGSSRPLIRVAGVDPKDALGEDGKLDIKKLEQAGRSGQSAGDSANVAEKTKAGTAIIHEKDQAETIMEADLALDWKQNPHKHMDHDGDWIKNDHHSQEHDTNWQKNIHEKRVQKDPSWKQMDNQAPKETKAEPQWVSMDSDKATAPKKAAPAATAQAKPTSSYGVTYAPCWDRTSQTLGSYKAVLTYKGPNDKTFIGAAAYQRHKTDDARLKIDLWVLQNVAKALFPLVNRQIQTPVFVPIHASSLRGNNEEKFFEFVLKLNENLRKKYIILDIMDDGLFKLEPLAKLISRLNEAVYQSAFTPDGLTGFKAPSVPGFQWVGIDLSRLDASSGISPDQLLKLQMDAQSLQANTFIFGISQRAQLAEFLEMGAEMLGGSALVRNTDKLRPPFALAIERLQGKTS